MFKYIINISKHKEHYCRIELPDHFEYQATQKAKEIAALFNAPCFIVTLTKWSNPTGTQIIL